MFKRRIKLFQENEIKRKNSLWKKYSDFNILHKKFVDKLIKVEDFYDIEKLAKHFAITELFSGHHSHLKRNFIT